MELESGSELGEMDKFEEALLVVKSEHEKTTKERDQFLLLCYMILDCDVLTVEGIRSSVKVIFSSQKRKLPE